MLVIPNYSLGGMKHDDPLVLAVAAATDGVLSEAGLSDYGCQPHCLAGADWLERIQFGLALQAMGVAYYPINEIGDVKHPGNWTLPCSEDPLNCITRAQREYVVGSYLLLKNNASAVYISGVQQYGGWPKCEPECGADVGAATGPAAVDQKTGVWSRWFQRAFVLVNPAAPPAAAVTVPLQNDVFTYKDVYGKAVTGSVELGAASAAILLVTPK